MVLTFMAILLFLLMIMYACLAISAMKDEEAEISFKEFMEKQKKDIQEDK